MRHGNRNAVERIFREVKQRSYSLSDGFSQVRATTAKMWLQAFAVWWNSLN
jgi:putative transposase